MSLVWTSLFAALALLGPSRPGGAASPFVLAAQRGQPATLRVQLRTQDLLLNREAPNRLILTTPWGKIQAQPRGVPSANTDFASYFAQVHPMTLSVKVPVWVRAGAYQAQLGGELFVCDKRERLCALRPVKVPVRIEVTTSPKAGGSTLTLRDQDLRSAGRKL